MFGFGYVWYAVFLGWCDLFGFGLFVGDALVGVICGWVLCVGVWFILLLAMYGCVT